MTNPNACQHCNHKQHPDGGWCYMFRTEPTAPCTHHTARPAASLAFTQMIGIAIQQRIEREMSGDSQTRQGTEATAKATPEMKPFYHDGKLVGYQKRNRAEKTFYLPAGEN